MSRTPPQDIRFDIDHQCRNRDMLANPLRVIGLTLNIAMLAIAGWFLITRMDMPSAQTKAILAVLFVIQVLRPAWQRPNAVIGRIMVAQDQLALMGGRTKSASGQPANVARLIYFDEIKQVGAFGFTIGISKKDGTTDSVPCGPKTPEIAALIRQRMDAMVPCADQAEGQTK